MKNLMKAPMNMTMDNWPSRNPSVNERLVYRQLVKVDYDRKRQTMIAAAVLADHLDPC